MIVRIANRQVGFILHPAYQLADEKMDSEVLKSTWVLTTVYAFSTNNDGLKRRGQWPAPNNNKRRIMAEIILVHGIDQQQKSADKLESAWLPALAGGVRDAGFPDVADRIWRNAGKPGSIETRIAFYGNLFLEPGQQGNDPGEFTSEEAQFAQALALEWLQHVAERATKQKMRETGERELAYVTRQMGMEQGAGTIVRSAMGSLARVSWFAPFGMGFAERFVNSSFAQVTRYFTGDAIRSTALESVFKLIGP